MFLDNPELADEHADSRSALLRICIFPGGTCKEVQHPR